jgi:hypothetical protein
MPARRSAADAIQVQAATVSAAQQDKKGIGNDHPMAVRTHFDLRRYSDGSVPVLSRVDKQGTSANRPLRRILRFTILLHACLVRLIHRLHLTNRVAEHCTVLRYPLGIRALCAGKHGGASWRPAGKGSSTLLTALRNHFLGPASETEVR